MDADWKPRSAVWLPHTWYIACESAALGEGPRSVEVCGVPLVVFRDHEKKARAFLDRCPHRNVPLSEGRVRDGQLECRYHGWRFSGDGACVAIPGLCDKKERAAHSAQVFPVVERQGYVWVWPSADVANTDGPHHFAYLERQGYKHIRYDAHFECGLHAAAENILDVPHTAFLHRGLFRGGQRHRVTVEVRRYGDVVEASYLGEPRPGGLAGRLLAPGGGEVQHCDRFVLPSIAQVEYRLGPRRHIVVESFLTPQNAKRTALHTVASFRLPIPSFLLRWFFLPAARRIVAQDASVLAAQTKTIHRFQEERFSHTEADVLGPHILRLLKQGGRAEVLDREAAEVDRLELEI